MQVLKQDFLPDQLQCELSKSGFEGCITVQARQTLEETAWLLNLASENDFIKGVVGWVDLCSDEVDEQLREFAANPKLVGVRHVVHDEPDDQFMARPDFQQGISQLEKYNLTYDLLVFPKHFPLALELVKTFPNQKFVVDHLAKPLIRDQVLSPWKEDIERLAQLPNVYCKLSGMVTEADVTHWKQEHFIRYLDVVFNCFGADKLMIGSDWPVCTLGGSYQEVVDLVRKYLAHFPQETKDKILGMNCSEFYLS